MYVLASMLYSKLLESRDSASTIFVTPLLSTRSHPSQTVGGRPPQWSHLYSPLMCQ